ncbi:ATP phosphoribosyltransferase [Candidatus Bathyarchaeota archaeon]|nr:MAG: ATP phosphoribosyltransferase [Candidatus Bathyarchaeota archaeon]
MEIKIVLPNKGRLSKPSLNLLLKAGIIPFFEKTNQLYIQTIIPDVSVVFIRASDIPRFVEAGAADLGITGYDFIVESQAKVVELLDLEFGKAKLVLAKPEKSKIRSVGEINPKTRIATKFPVITKNFLLKNRKKAKILRISGACEIMPSLGVADLIVDVTSTGATLKTHKLEVVEEVMDSSARLIANKNSLNTKRKKIEELTLAIKSVLYAKRKKLIMMNVPEKNLQKVLKVIPSMAGPTLAKVESPTPMWEVYSVVDENETYKIITAVKNAGARDILILPIEKIVP